MIYNKGKCAIRKLLAAVLCIVLMVSALSPAVFANDEIRAELYEIAYQNGRCLITGRSFVSGGGTVELSAAPKVGSVIRVQTVLSADGSFTFDFNAGFNSYNISIKDKGREILEFSLDLSGLAGAFANNGYGISGISLKREIFTITGVHSGVKKSIVTLQATDKNAASGFTPDTIKAISDAQSDASGAYQIGFKVNPGQYTVYLKADGINVSGFDFSCPDLGGSLTKTENDFGWFISKLSSLTAKLEEEIASAEAEGISTDYEKAYLEIIKKFIIYINNEASRDDYSRMGQYNYALTRIYNEAITNLEAYRSGEKEAPEMVKFKSGGITFDGTSVIARTETDGVEELRPVFLTGYGIWDTVVKEIPFLSSIGHNFIQVEALMDHILVPVRGGYWIPGGLNESAVSEVEMESSAESKVSGTYALKIKNHGETIHNVFRTLSQKVDAKANTTYIYGLKAKGKGLTEQKKEDGVSSAWFNMGGIYGGIRNGIKNSDNWQSYDFEYTTKATETELDFLLVFQDYIGELYIDDIYLYEKGTTTNLLKNGDFDYYIDTPTVYDTEAEKHGWFINHGGLEKLKAALDRAEQYNVAVDVILNPAEMPDFIKYSDSKITAAGSGYLPFALDNKTVRDSISIYARAVADTIEDCSAAVSLCITNEPEVKSAYTDYYNEKWCEYLKTVYDNDIEKLKEVYAKEDWKAIFFSSFSDVKIPTSMSETRQFYDYIGFNDSLLAEFHTWYVNEVKKVSDIPVHSKTMQYLRENYANYYRQGTNYELVKDLFDINGCDAWTQYTTENSLSAKMAWYDMMTSLRERPVWNTEDHITEAFEGQVVYTDIEPLYVAADVWNGAIHGRGASAIWVLNDLDTMTALGTSSKHSSTNVIHKPEQMMQTAKVSMDINRLSKEITALQKENPKVGILYSRTSVALNENHTLAVMNAYDAATKSGQKVGFVTDTTYSDIPNYELLIVPEATNVSSGLVNAVQSYIAGGGQVLLLGSGSLERNESKVSHSSSVVNYIKQNADRTSTVSGKIQSMGLSDITLVDADTGLVAENIEWSYTKYDGSYIINVLNYETEGAKDIRVKLMGTEIGAVTDLRSGIKAEDGVLTAKAMVPMLLKAESCIFDLVDQNGNVIEVNINTVKSGKIRCTVADADGTTVMALYKDGVCLEISTDGFLQVPEMTDGDYRIMAAVWDLEALKPLIPCRNIFN